MLLIGFSFFIFTANAHAGEITDLNDLENPLLTALIILVTVQYLFSLLFNFLLHVLSSTLEISEKEPSQRRSQSRQPIDVPSDKAKVIPLFKNRH